MPQLSLCRRETPLKDETLLAISDPDLLILNSLLLGIALDAPLLGIQVMFLSLEKKPPEP